MPVNRGIEHWWAYSLPREHETVFRDYLRRYPQFRSTDGSTKNPVPMPGFVSGDMVRWWKHSDVKGDPSRWVTYNAQPQGLVTALKRGWLPLAPANAVEADGETPKRGIPGESGKQSGPVPKTTCGVCGRAGFASKTGVLIHKAVAHSGFTKRKKK